MSEKASYQKMSADLEVAVPKATRALPVSTDDLNYIKNRIAQTKPELNIFQSTGFFFSGASLTSFFQAMFGNFQPAPQASVSTNEILLWSFAGFCLLGAVLSFVFCYLRYRDARRAGDDLTEYIALLEHKFEGISHEGINLRTSGKSS